MIHDVIVVLIVIFLSYNVETQSVWSKRVHYIQPNMQECSKKMQRLSNNYMSAVPGKRTIGICTEMILDARDRPDRVWR